MLLVLPAYFRPDRLASSPNPIGYCSLERHRQVGRSARVRRTARRRGPAAWARGRRRPPGRCDSRQVVRGRRAAAGSRPPAAAGGQQRLDEPPLAGIELRVVCADDYVAQPLAAAATSSARWARLGQGDRSGRRQWMSCATAAPSVSALGTGTSTGRPDRPGRAREPATARLARAASGSSRASLRTSVMPAAAASNAAAWWLGRADDHERWRRRDEQAAPQLEVHDPPNRLVQPRGQIRLALHRVSSRSKARRCCSALKRNSSRSAPARKLRSAASAVP